MDIFAHGLWAAALARTANPRPIRRISPGWSAAIGPLPDLFAFTVPVVLRVQEQIHHRTPSRHFDLAWELYEYSHSLIVFAAVFGLVWLIMRRPVFELLAWLLHILIDIPSHTAAFFPTPFLWPLSNYHFSGISWARPGFMIVNYTSIVLAYVALAIYTRRLRRREALSEVPVEVPVGER